ncbi:MAG: YceI family protein [Aureispira sp.]
MKNYLLASFLIFFLTTITTQAQKKTWVTDPTHCHIVFEITHFDIATMRGTFDKFEGKMSSSKADFTDAQLNLVIQAASINTNQKQRDAHLCAPDFLDAEKHPTIIFKSTAFEKVEEQEYLVKGDFTMKGVTAATTLKAIYKGQFEHPAYKKTMDVFEITGTIPRLDFGVAKEYDGSVLGTVVKFQSTVEMMQD